MSEYWFICFEWQSKDMPTPKKGNWFINQPPWAWLHNRRNTQDNFVIISAIPVSVDTFDKWHNFFD